MPLVYDPTQTHSTELLIVGGGPVGLFGALCAAKRGVAVTLLDRGFRGYARGHATLLHPSTLRLLTEFGLGSKLLAAGRPVARVELHLEHDFTRSLELPTPALTIAQSAFEELLLKELANEDVEIEAPWEATALTQSESSVEVHATRRELRPMGSPTVASDWQAVESTVIDARFVIGADGRQSSVRSALGIEASSVGVRETFAMFEGPRSVPRTDLSLSFAQGLGGVALPLSGDCGRWGFELPEGSEIVPDVDHLRALLVERAVWEPNPPVELHWSSVALFERRLAQSFGRGRVWLAGDAAHVTSPFGGQSVNGGLMEVHQLVESMAGCLRKAEALSELEQIGSRRVREWQRLLGVATRVEARPGSPASLSRYGQRILSALPASGRDLQFLLGQLGLTVS